MMSFYEQVKVTANDNLVNLFEYVFGSGMYPRGSGLMLIEVDISQTLIHFILDIS